MLKPRTSPAAPALTSSERHKKRLAVDIKENGVRKLNEQAFQEFITWDKDCRHCYGRGHKGVNLHTGLFIFCKCAEPKKEEKVEAAA
jgi:hypothetical protein